MAALKYWVWLTTLPGLTDHSKQLLMAHFSSPEDIYYADEEALWQVDGLRKEQAALLDNKSLSAADRVLSDCARKDIFLVTMADALYPERLHNIYQPPLLLYGKGAMPLFDEEAAVAVVGTRSCTPYGINSHRLLVCGERTENAQEAKHIRVVSDAVQIEPLVVAPVVAAPILLLLVILLLCSGRKKKVPI